MGFEGIKNKIASAYQSGGLSTLFLRAVRVAWRVLFTFHVSSWYRRDLNEPFQQIDPAVAVDLNFNAIEAVLDWEKNLKQNTFTLLDHKENNVAYENRHNYIAVNLGHQIIGYLKIGFNRIFFKEYTKEVGFSKKTAFIYDTYVSENTRGQGIAPYMINEAMKKLHQEGFDYLGCHIVPSNTASQRAYQKIGFKKVRSVWHLRLFGIKLFNCRTSKIV